MNALAASLCLVPTFLAAVFHSLFTVLVFIKLIQWLNLATMRATLVTYWHIYIVTFVCYLPLLHWCSDCCGATCHTTFHNQIVFYD